MSYLPSVTVEALLPPPGGGSSVWTEITNVQSFDLTKGRTKISDNWRSGTGTIYGRRNDLFPSNMEIGTQIQFTFDAQGSPPGSQYYLYFRVADVTFNYGLIPSLDTWVITLEDAFAYLGRNNIDISWADGTNTAIAADQCCFLSSVSLVYPPAGGKSTCGAQTISNANSLDVLQTVMNTEQGWLVATSGNIVFLARGFQGTLNTVNFTDSGAGSNPVKYDQVVFRSMADNYADQVIVHPRGSTDVVTGDGVYSYNLDSYSLNSGQAAYLGQYISGVFDVQNSTPMQISMQLNEQSNVTWFNAMDYPVNARVTLRGHVYNSVVIGSSITGDPANVRFTFNLASSDFFSFLTLDNTIYGTLDDNKLGY